MSARTICATPSAWTSATPTSEQVAAAEKCPNPMIALRLKRRLAVGVSVEEEEEAYAKLDYLLDQMEQRLADGPWIAGPMFTLADVSMAPMVNRIEVLSRPEMIAPAKRPSVADWWAAHSGAAGLPDRVLVQESGHQGSGETIGVSRDQLAGNV